MTPDASGQVVVITGASSGIGRETARQFATRGACLVLAARNEQALQAAADEVVDRGGTALVVPTDVAEWAQVQHLAQTARDRFGRIDVWVNNAVVSGYGELAALPVTAIDRILQVSLRGQVYGVKAVLPIMRGQGHGTIIGVSSGLGIRAVPLQIPYCMAKAGLVALYEGLRLEERRARSGVHVTTILPASVDTPYYDSAASLLGNRPAPIPPRLPAVGGRRGDRVLRRPALPSHLRGFPRGGSGFGSTAQPRADRPLVDRGRPNLRAPAAR